MTSFSNCDVLFPNCDELFPNCDELFLIVTSYSVCDFYRETEIINKNHVIIVKAHTNTTFKDGVWSTSLYLKSFHFFTECALRYA